MRRKKKDFRQSENMPGAKESGGVYAEGIFSVEVQLFPLSRAVLSMVCFPQSTLDRKQIIIFLTNCQANSPAGLRHHAHIGPLTSSHHTGILLSHIITRRKMSTAQ